MLWACRTLRRGMGAAIAAGSTRTALRGDHLMPFPRPKMESLPHAVFLQRVSNHSSVMSLEARLGQGAFLALRLVDLLAPAHGDVSADAFHYQWVATDRFCRELRGAATEGAHVHGIAASAADAQRLSDVQLLAPALVAYAHFLEDEGDRLAAADAVAARLRIARVQRKMNRFDEAEAAYAEAGEMAAAVNDHHSISPASAYAASASSNL